MVKILTCESLFSTGALNQTENQDFPGWKVHRHTGNRRIYYFFFLLRELALSTREPIFTSRRVPGF